MRVEDLNIGAWAEFDAAGKERSRSPMAGSAWR